MAHSSAAGAAIPGNLPSQLTSFIGREQEMAEVMRLLTGFRQVTLTGVGGAGKTRLALAVAGQVAGDYADGVWPVELAALTDAALIPQAVAAALGVREAPGRTPADSVNEFLRARTLLLVLDNCEHLVDACAQLVERLLRTCPGLRILATSREALGVAGETSWRVPSLSLPDAARRGVGSGDIGASEAVRLFVDRAAQALPSFRLTEGHAPAVVEICRRLDGIPLAIELAAARVKGLSAEQIAARLDDRFRLLTGGSRTALPRQQTLRAMVDWSHSLLSEPERVLLRRLSTFAGGWTLEAAEAVCAAEPLSAPDVLDLTLQLVEKSLVLAEEVGDARRYRLLETIRQYAREKLVDAGEVEAVRDRHLACYLALAVRADLELEDADDVAWFNQLESEYDNLRAALEWGPNSDQVGAAVRLAGALGYFWTIYGNWSEGRAWLEAALAGSREAAPTEPGAPPAVPAQAEALCGAGSLAMRQGDLDRASAFYEEALALARRHVARKAVAEALRGLGTVAVMKRRYEQAGPLLQEGLAAYRELADSRGMAQTLAIMANVPQGQKDFGRAAALYEESLALSRELNNRMGMAGALMGLGNVAKQQGDNERAAALLRETLPLLVQARSKPQFAMCMGLLTGIAALSGQNERAARLFGATEAAYEAIGALYMPPTRREHETHRAAVQAALGETAFAAARAEGRAMTPDQAIAEAGQIAAPGQDAFPSTAASAAGRGPAAPAQDHPAGLTEREVDVLRLVAQGLTSARVAERLVISAVTVSAHLRNIYAKIGVNSRSAATRWAVDHGLV